MEKQDRFSSKKERELKKQKQQLRKDQAQDSLAEAIQSFTEDKLTSFLEQDVEKYNGTKLYDIAIRAAHRNLQKLYNLRSEQFFRKYKECFEYYSGAKLSKSKFEEYQKEGETQIQEPHRLVITLILEYINNQYKSIREFRYDGRAVARLLEIKYNEVEMYSIRHARKQFLDILADWRRTDELVEKYSFM